MRVRNRFATVMVTIALGVASAIGLSACGLGTAGAAGAALSPEASALTALGFSNGDVTSADGVAGAPVAAASGSPKGNKAHPLLRRLAIRRGLARHVEHGEVTISTKNGDKTIEIQRGTITAISDTSLTVKSADGFTLTWTIGSPIHVIEHRTTVQPTDLAAGDMVGVAGLKDATGAVAAKLIVVPNASKTTGS